MIRRDPNAPKEIKLRPRRPAGEAKGDLAPVYKLLMATARRMRAASSSPKSKGGGAKRPGYSQRCAVRISYAKNKLEGQWKAHGRYLARDSAQDATLPQPEVIGLGFNATETDVLIPAQLERWQLANDPRMWKLILSPEFDEKTDLTKLTREVLAQMEKDLQTKLEWVAIAHHNTEHAHVHVALRGIDERGLELRMEPAYVKNGIRAIAENRTTAQLGYRTRKQAEKALGDEVKLARCTSLDREIQKQKVGTEEIVFNPAAVKPVHLPHVYARLKTLESFGLAKKNAERNWVVQPDFDRVLRVMANTLDKQRTIRAHGAIASDPRLPFDAGRFTEIAGRILVHGEDDATGRAYLIVEGIDAKLHYVPYDTDIDEARAHGNLKTNNYVHLKRRSKFATSIEDLGPSGKLLKHPTHFAELAEAFLKRGIEPPPSDWKGWLGQYHDALRAAVVAKAAALERAANMERTRPVQLPLDPG